jgi:hypothetical protein
VKEYVIRRLKRLGLDDEREERLWRVILHVVDQNDGRRELAYYGRLAASIADPALVEALEARVSSSDPVLAFRASVMLDRVVQRQSESAHSPQTTRRKGDGAPIIS